MPLIVRDEYTVYVEFIPEQGARSHWLHCDVHRWNHRVLRDLRSALDTLTSLTRRPYFILVEPSNTKLAKFARMCGLVEINHVWNASGALMRQFVLYPKEH